MYMQKRAQPSNFHSVILYNGFIDRKMKVFFNDHHHDITTSRHICVLFRLTTIIVATVSEQASK